MDENRIPEASGRAPRPKLKIALLAVAVLALALIGWSAAAGAFGGHGWFAGHGRGGGHGFHQSARALLAKLDLREDQQVYVESLHETLMDLKHAHAEHGPEHLHQVLQRMANDDLEPAEGRAMVDEHIEHLRAFGYRISDDLTGLAASLDDDQRAQMVEHFQTLHEAHRLLLGLQDDGSAGENGAKGQHQKHGHGGHGLHH